MEVTTIAVNGADVSCPTMSTTLLVEFLRAAGLTGTHVGCDTSQCGACNVLLDGKLVKACSVFAAEVQERSVRTIEGVAGKDGDLHPLQQAFQDHHGLQCGYCTPGMIMTGLALLRENPNPSEAEIRAFLGGSICRCTGYQNIVRAIQAATAQEERTDV